MIDVYILFAAYFISCIAIGVSIYALYRINEIIEYYTKKPKYKAGSAYEKYEVQQKPKAKGFWD